MNIQRVSSPQFSEVYPVETDDAEIVKEKLEKFAKKDEARMALLKKSLLGKGVFHFRDTLVPCILKLPHFWFGIATFVGVVIAGKIGEGVPIMDDETVSSLNFFMAFFLIFYMNQNYNRHFAMYDKCMSCEGRIFDAAGMMHGFCIKGHQAEVHTFIRYLNAVHVLAYVGMNDTYQRDDFLVPYNIKHRVLEPHEFKYLDQRHDLRKASGGAYREVISWSIAYVKHLCDQNVLNHREMTCVVNQINILRGSLAALYDLEFQPIPFIYIHMLNILLLILMPVLGYHSGTFVTRNLTLSNFFYYLASYLFYSGFYLGLKVAGLQLSEPIGDDLCDFCIHHFLTFTLKESMKIIESIKEETWIPGQMEKVAKRTKPWIEGELMKIHGFYEVSAGFSGHDMIRVAERGILREMSHRKISTINDVTEAGDAMLS